MPHNLFPGLGAIPLLAGMLLALTPGGLPAQGVCQETCPNPLADPAGATLCAARIATCTGKLSLYQGYMSQLSLGSVKAQLTPLYIQILAPLFPTAGVTAWRFAWANRQPVNNSTTDCTTTYFNPNATYANTLAQGKLTQDWEFRLLYHELTHVEQCKAMGGRDRYAKIWFAQAELAFLRTANLDQIHDLQPMENDAAAKAATLLETTRRNRDASGALVPPQADLGIFSLSQSEDYRAGSCTVRISIENVGSAPLPIAAYSNGSALVRVTTGTTSLGDFTLAQVDPNGILRGAPPQRVTVTWRPGNRYTYTGPRSFTAQVDPNRVISDSRRTNNIGEGSFLCGVTSNTSPRSP